MQHVSPFRTEQEIAARVAVLARQINGDYAGRTLDVVYMLNGAAIFCADLIRQLRVPLRLHPFGFTSYGQPTASGEVRVTLDVAQPLHGCHVLMVEGIVVSGRTPAYVVDLLRRRGSASVELCAVGVKRNSLAVELPIKYAAFELDKEIAVGYGIGEGAEKALPFLGMRSPDQEVS
jgi:hypoxanthine phosphoribosyltransferase